MWANPHRFLHRVKQNVETEWHFVRGWQTPACSDGPASLALATDEGSRTCVRSYTRTIAPWVRLTLREGRTQGRPVS
jgi:hypothetical protein